MKIAVFVSGGGTNLQAIIDNTKVGILKDIEISLVLSSSSGAYALTRASDNNLRSVVINAKDYATRDEWDLAVLHAVEEHVRTHGDGRGGLLEGPGGLVGAFRLPVQGRSGEAQFLGGLGEVPRPGDGDKIAKITKFHIENVSNQHGFYIGTVS